MRSIAIGLAAWLAVLGIPRAASGATQISVRLQTVAPGHVQGTAILSDFKGGSKVSLRLSGLPPRGVAIAVLRAGTCADRTHLSASTAFIARLKADSSGIASGVRPVTYHREVVPVSAMTDGAHVILVSVSGRVGVSACGTIPRSG
jgi:hypothetical protein